MIEHGGVRRIFGHNIIDGCYAPMGCRALCLVEQSHFPTLVQLHHIYSAFNSLLGCKSGTDFIRRLLRVVTSIKREWSLGYTRCILGRGKLPWRIFRRAILAILCNLAQVEERGVGQLWYPWLLRRTQVVRCSSFQLSAFQLCYFRACSGRRWNLVELFVML